MRDLRRKRIKRIKFFKTRTERVDKSIKSGKFNENLRGIQKKTEDFEKLCRKIEKDVRKQY